MRSVTQLSQFPEVFLPTLLKKKGKSLLSSQIYSTDAPIPKLHGPGIAKRVPLRKLCTGINSTTIPIKGVDR